MSKKLVIFDCDGTLVDTEYLYCAAFSKLITSVGLDYCTPEYAMSNFKGGKVSHTISMLEKKHDIDFPDNYEDLFIEYALDFQKDYQKIIPDAKEVIADIKENSDVSICVASNGERECVISSLKMAGIYKFFNENEIFTSAEVKNPKPAPDIFIHTCNKMGFSTDETIVIEDSITGIKAAKSANIDVIAFTGAIHDPKDKYQVVNEMKKMQPIKIIDDFIHIISEIKPFEKLDNKMSS